ncbi:MAG: hypothetical protein K9G31_07660 [Crocinitomicaceae bacterium]|nr:hypothetical protein [Crocinitomicaceae bacterium]
MEDIVKQVNRIVSQSPNSKNGVDYILENGSWLGESFNYLPSGIIDKRETGIGATSLEIDSKRNSIIIEPLLSTVKLKADNNDDLFAYLVEKNSIARDLKSYLEDVEKEPKKIILVIDNLKRLINDIGENIFNFFLLFDEIDYMQGSSSYRKNMELGLDIGMIHGNFALVPATLINFSDPELANLPRTSFCYESKENTNIQTKFIYSYKLADSLRNVIALNHLCSFIIHKLKNSDEKIFVAINNVKIIDELSHFLIKGKYIDNQDITLLISESNYKNQLVRNKYSQLKIVENKLPTRLNFATSAYFNGFDIVDNYSLVIFSSPLSKTMLLTINEIKQIYGRCRTNSINDFVLITLDMKPDEGNKNNYINYELKDWMKLAKTHIEIADCIDKHYIKYRKENNWDETTKFFYNQFKEQVEGNEFNLARTKLNLTKENLVEMVLSDNRNKSKNVPAFLQIDYLQHYYSTLREIYLKKLISLERLVNEPDYFSDTFINIETKLFEYGFNSIDPIETWEYIKFKPEKKTHKDEINEALIEVQEHSKQQSNYSLSPLQNKIKLILNNGVKQYSEKSIIQTISELNSKEELEVFNNYVSMDNFKKHPLVVLLKNSLTAKKTYSSSEIVDAVKIVFNQINLNTSKKLSFTIAKKYMRLVYKMNETSVRIGDKVETHYKLEKYNPFPELKKNRRTKSPTKAKISTKGLSGKKS